jgi:excinuclease UvrABC ATPase subunit
MIKIEGARVHNLKNIDVEIPRNSLTVITGLSGSGKSSLAFDTIFAEGQRRYVETFSEDGVERQRRFAAAAQSGDDRQTVARNLHIHILQVVNPRPLNLNHE